MKFFAHSDLEGRHALLSASKPHWLRYSEERLFEVFSNMMSAALGTRLHAFASEAIILKQRMPENKVTMNAYVNDAIRWRMSTEVKLRASDNAFGTADAISFHKNVLRIHDLKNGVNPCTFDQLIVYACFFMIEYKYKPDEIEVILRIYQNDDVKEYIPTHDELYHAIDKILTSDALIEQWKAEARS